MSNTCYSLECKVDQSFLQSVTMSQLSSYNDLPYSCHPVRLTHPDNLASKALLYGLAPAPIEQCRVLEIGCGNGTNLLSLAHILPNSDFVGIDYAQRQVDQGRAIAESIGCQNIELHAMSVADLNGQLGKFDYILCHGVYSWVSPMIAEQILKAIRECLSPAGVAYVSYNVYPGWHLRGLVREILCRQTAASASPAARVQQARQYLDFLITHAPGSDSVYGSILKREKDILSKTPDTYLFHEHLEELNEPVYFHQFAQRVSSCGLQYLCEASFNSDEAMFSDELRDQLQRLAPSRIEYEQQVDFLCNGTFRRSLLCHAEVAISAQPSILAVKHMHMRAPARLEKPIEDFRSSETATFLGANGETITTPHPLLKASLSTLADAWPQTLTLEEIQTRCAKLLNSDADPVTRLRENELLSSALLRCHRTGLVEFHSSKPHFVVTIATYPRVSALSRWQAAHGEPVCNLVHDVVDVNEFDRLVMSLLDGSKDYAELETLLVEHVLRGDIVLHQNGEAVTQRQVIATVVQHSLAQSLKKFAQLNCLH